MKKHCTHEEAASDHGTRKSSPAQHVQTMGDNTSAEMPERKAYADARHLDSASGLKEAACSADNASKPESEPDWEDTLELPDPANFNPSEYSKNYLMHMPKEQIADSYIEMRTQYEEVLRAYTNLCERMRRDNYLHFYEKKDSFGKIPVQVSDSSLPQENEGSETESDGGSAGNRTPDSVLTRMSSPRRGEGCTADRDNDIPTLTITEEWTEEKMAAEFTGHKYQLVSSEFIEEYRTLPARIFLLRHEVFVYKDLVTGKMHRTASAESIKMLSGSRVSADMLGYIAERYYGEGIPVSKQVKLANQEGCKLTKQEVYMWLRQFGDTAVKPVAVRMLELILAQPAIQMDETYWRVMEETLETGRKYCYFWLARTSEKLDVHPITVTTFVQHRDTEALLEILKDYSGTVECDGYGVYPAVEKILVNLEITSCLEHIRHYFFNALKAIPGIRAMSKENRAQIPAQAIVNEIDGIFEQEDHMKGFDREKRGELRKSVIMPLVIHLYEIVDQYLKDAQFDQGSLFGKALIYAANRKEHLMAGVLNPDIPLHNSACERFFIPMSVFRNNSKQFTKKKGAETASYYFSIVGTCRENKCNASIYFRYLYEKVPGLMKKNEEKVQKGDLSFLDEIMPWTANYSEYEEACRKEAANLFNYLQTVGK